MQSSFGGTPAPCTFGQRFYRTVCAEEWQKLSSMQRLGDQAIRLYSGKKCSFPISKIDSVQLPYTPSKKSDYIMCRFSDNTHLYEVYDKETLGGALLLETGTVVHEQYSSVSQAGKQQGTEDLLFHFFINDAFRKKRFLVSEPRMAKPGNTLNRGLMNWKQSFGDRTHTIDIYQVDTSNFKQLEVYA